MQPIPLTFEDRTFRYIQLAREGMIALYAQDHKAGHVKRYEVVRLRVHREHTWPNGVTTPEREAYPGSASWGLYGHTCFTLSEAQELMARWREQREESSDAAPQAPDDQEEETP